MRERRDVAGQRETEQDEHMDLTWNRHQSHIVVLTTWCNNVGMQQEVKGEFKKDICWQSHKSAIFAVY